MRADDWPQWLGPKRDGIWREDGILAKFPSGGPTVLWKKEIGPGYTGPAVVGDRVYVMDRDGKQPTRGSESPGKAGLDGKERLWCLNAGTGAVIWKDECECTYRIACPFGPRTTPIVHEGKVYTYGAMGDLRCLDAATGKLVWHRSVLADYKCKPPVWGYASHPHIEGDKVIVLVGGEGSAAVAFQKDTGKEVWKSLTVKEVGYAPIMTVVAGGKRQVIVWHTEAINALDPENGSVFWSIKFPEEVEPVRPGIAVSTPLQVGDALFITAPHHGSIMLGLDKTKPGARVLWKGKTNTIDKTDALHSLMSTPAIKDGHVYGVCAFGELRCLDAKDGKRLWETFAATAKKKAFLASAFIVQQGDRFFVFNDLGDLVIANLTPKGYEEIDRAHLLEPTMLSRGRDVVWSHPAFANRCVYARNDKEIICVSLAAFE